MKNLLTVTSILLCVLLVGCSDKVEYVGDLKDGNHMVREPLPMRMKANMKENGRRGKVMVKAP